MSDMVKITIAICVAVVLVAGIVVLGYDWQTRRFVEGGYHECSIAGLPDARWCK